MQRILCTKQCNTNPKHTICDPSQVPTGDLIFRRDALYAAELMSLKVGQQESQESAQVLLTLTSITNLIYTME